MTLRSQTPSLWARQASPTGEAEHISEASAGASRRVRGLRIKNESAMCVKGKMQSAGETAGQHPGQPGRHAMAQRPLALALVAGEIARADAGVADAALRHRGFETRRAFAHSGADGAVAGVAGYGLRALGQAFESHAIRLMYAWDKVQSIALGVKNLGVRSWTRFHRFRHSARRCGRIR